MTRSSEAAILADDRVEEELGLLLHRLGERVVVLRIEQVVREDLVEVLQAQPLRRKTRRERLRALVGQHAAHLLLDSGGGRERADVRRPHQLGVRHRAPQEERQARRDVLVGEAEAGVADGAVAR